VAPYRAHTFACVDPTLPSFPVAISAYLSFATIFYPPYSAVLQPPSNPIGAKSTLYIPFFNPHFRTHNLRPDP